MVEDTTQSYNIPPPFPWFGGKGRVARAVWQRFGNVPNYVEPFFGSGAILLNRPHPPGIETVCDADGLLANFWRATVMDPNAVARYADWPITEQDLHARHLWLLGQKESLTERLIADPDWYDARAAGWWVWGICAWIGGDWCSGVGPWTLDEHGTLVRRDAEQNQGAGVSWRRPHLRHQGQGILRKRPCLGTGRGIYRKRPLLGNEGAGIHRPATAIQEYFQMLHARLRRVRVVCGDWTRVMGPAVTTGNGLTAIFLDPPYPEDEQAVRYAGGSHVWHEVLAWCQSHGNNPRLRIALCGYESPNVSLPGWHVYRWKTHGGYAHLGNGRGQQNRYRETIWFSPHCLVQPTLLECINE